MTAPILAVPTANGRYYFHPRAQNSVPSVTNILDQKSKPLFRSGLKKAAQYASENIGRLASLDKQEVYTLVSNPPRRDDDPAAIGDIVHKWIDRRLKGDRPTEAELKEAPNTARWMYERFLAFIKHYNPEFTDSEFTVWSNKYGYAGTADLSFVLGGQHILCDTKTGKQPYPEVGMQLAALSHADVVLLPDGTERPLPRYDKFAVLHLRPRSFTLHPIDHIEEAFQSFLALKGVFDWEVNYADKTIVASPQFN